MIKQVEQARFRGCMPCVLWAIVLLTTSSCGGNGGSDEPSAFQGSVESHTLTSRINGNTYPLRVYLPPPGISGRAAMPVIYALDGDWWFTQLIEIVQATKAQAIVIGIGNNANRAVDYVPPNACTPGGGGHAAYLAFIQQELIAYTESHIGGDPKRRVLLGHSHGGSFVYYALFAAAPGAHPFKAYLASDASLGCMPAVAAAWEAAYAASFAALPVRLHISHTPVNGADIALAQQILDRRYAQLALNVQVYNGTHTGIVPAAFADAVAFALTP